MVREVSKSFARRSADRRFATRWFVGEGIDIGSGDDPLSQFTPFFPLIRSIRPWDRADGDAMHMTGVADDSYDFVHSSHCLEHLDDPMVGLRNWIRICRPGGHLIITVPDEDLYEQGVFPSTFNAEHQWTFTIAKAHSWSPKSINLVDLLAQFSHHVRVLKVDLLDATFRYGERRHDQTLGFVAESAIEFVLQKRPVGDGPQLFESALSDTTKSSADNRGMKASNKVEIDNFSDDNTPQPLVPLSIAVPTRYGQMIISRYDINQANSLIKTGVAVDHDEIMLLSKILKNLGNELTVIDVGANFGTFTLGLAPFVGEKGEIHAFEPQRIIYNMLAGSIALTSYTNIFCYNMAVGDREGSIEIPQFDYRRELNFGSVEFGPKQHEQLTQLRGNDPNKVEYVPLTTLDRLSFKCVDLLKIDAEGMELQVIAGAGELLRRCRPVLFIEFLKVDRELLRHEIEAFNYNIFEYKINYICAPTERGDLIRNILA